MWIMGYSLPFVFSHKEEAPGQRHLTCGEQRDQASWLDCWSSIFPYMVPDEYHMPSATIALAPGNLLTNHKRYNDWVYNHSKLNSKAKLFFFFSLSIQFARSHPMITHATGIMFESLIEVMAAWMSGSRAKFAQSHEQLLSIAVL